MCLVVAVGARAGAGTCDEEAVALRTHLEREAHRATTWNTAWAIAFGAVAVAQVTLAVTETDPFGMFDRDDEEVLYLGAGKATLGLLSRVVRPLRVHVPMASGDACADVAALRDAVADVGRQERQTFFVTHLGGLAL